MPTKALTIKTKSTANIRTFRQLLANYERDMNEFVSMEPRKVGRKEMRAVPIGAVVSYKIDPLDYSSVRSIMSYINREEGKQKGWRLSVKMNRENSVISITKKEAKRL